MLCWLYLHIFNINIYYYYLLLLFCFAEWDIRPQGAGPARAHDAHGREGRGD
jgi:hypothetical protein